MKYDFDKEINRRGTNSIKWNCKENELPMWIADMDFETFPGLKDSVCKIANLGIYGYSEIKDEFFEAIRNYFLRNHHFDINSEWMVYANGVIPSISSIIRRITSPNENVLVQQPVYNTFTNCIVNQGRHLVSSDLIYDNGEYHIDFEDLEVKLSNPMTTLMIVCNPHNPIGKIWSKEELSKIGELCDKHGVKVISDEIHCHLTNPDLSYVPFASVNDVNKKISITCLSGGKVFNIAGLQSACLVIPDEFLRFKVYRGLNNDDVAEPNIFAMDANIAAYSNGDDWVKELNEYIYENKRVFSDFLNEYLPNLKLVKSEATYLLGVDISYYSNDSLKFVEDLRNTTGLWVNPGSIYGPSGNSFIRINIATQRAKVLDACNRLKKDIESK